MVDWHDVVNVHLMIHALTKLECWNVSSRAKVVLQCLCVNDDDDDDASGALASSPSGA